ncbi:MAG TPA: hypothetical protein VN947_21055 [Polyangia bacterium]|nr:hypothetical protein [Polyangia bacterium]
MRSVIVTMLAGALLQLGCLQWVVPAHAPSDAPASVQQPLIPSDIFETLNNPTDAHAELCDIDGLHPNFPNDADQITKAFCQDFVQGGSIPQPHSLADLLALLNLDFKDPNGGNGVGGNPGFAILGHSSALTARKVSTLTPTAFVFTPPPADGSKPSGYVFLAFDPGETFVEVASHDPTLDTVNFYLVLFDKDCTNNGGCQPADVLTQNLTTGWSNLREYESSTSLNNTIADCRQCHAPDDSQPQMLRMQEIEPPFTHWFSMQTTGGQALFEDFHKAHPAGEDYGPIPGALVDKADPALMAQMVTQAGFGTQPNLFASAEIEAEVQKSAPKQPWANDIIGTSPTWQAAYGAAVAGQFIATPYHDVKVTDPYKLERMTKAYTDFMSGAATYLPDIRDVFYDAGLRDMGFAPKKNATGRELITQMCQQCHHSKLDLTISREKFLVDQLDTMTRDEKDVAIQRLQMDVTTRLSMPPALFRTITDDERQAMIDELSK